MIKSVTILGLAATVGAALFAVPQASAEPPKVPPPANVHPQPVAPPIAAKPPIDLGAKKHDAFNRALVRSGLPLIQIVTPPPHIRLLPSAPTAAGGARISSVGRSTYFGSTADMPDGAFLIDPEERLPSVSLAGISPPPPPSGRVDLAFSVEPGKLYMVDCRLAPGPSPIARLALPWRPVTFAREGAAATQSITPEDGHYMYPFRTPEGLTPYAQLVSLTVAPDPAFFFGCEVTKLQ